MLSCKEAMQHHGISLTMEGIVNLQLSSKSVGVFEAFYNSVKVSTDGWWMMLEPYFSSHIYWKSCYGSIWWRALGGSVWFSVPNVHNELYKSNTQRQNLIFFSFIILKTKKMINYGMMFLLSFNVFGFAAHLLCVKLHKPYFSSSTWNGLFCCLNILMWITELYMHNAQRLTLANFFKHSGLKIIKIRFLCNPCAGSNMGSPSIGVF